MAPAAAGVTGTTRLTVVLNTSLALIEQFLASLVVDSTASVSSSDVTTTATSEIQTKQEVTPLDLLSASATSLKSSATKLSLLTINTPFTPSAIVSLLQPLNTSVLPSLVTAALLVSGGSTGTSTPQSRQSFYPYPHTFARECTVLTRSVLRDLQALLCLVRKRADEGQAAYKADVSEVDKRNVTEGTGKLWEGCDSLTAFAKEDVVGFVVRKAKQWLELMKDAVKEFEEWDPEEEDDEDDFGDEDDFFGTGDSHYHGDEHESRVDLTQNDNSVAAGAFEIDRHTDKVKAIDTNRATILSGIKGQALKVLARIPQSVHVVIRQRLEKYPPRPSQTQSTSTDNQAATSTMPNTHRKTLDLVLSKTRLISDYIDESAEAMYMGDPELCLRKAGEARALTIDLVSAVIEPWTLIPSSSAPSSSASPKEDQYIKKALAWIEQVDTKSSADTATNPTKTASVRA